MGHPGPEAGTQKFKGEEEQKEEDEEEEDEKSRRREGETGY